MITLSKIKDAQSYIILFWKEDGEKVIEACKKITPFNGGFRSFIKYCSDNTDDLTDKLLSGIQRLFPEVRNAIPKDLGLTPFICVYTLLTLCGVDTGDYT